MAQKLSKRELLEYAEEGLRILIGCHPMPHKYVEEIQLYEAHLKEVQRRLKLVDRNPLPEERTE